MSYLSLISVISLWSAGGPDPPHHLRLVSLKLEGVTPEHLVGRLLLQPDLADRRRHPHLGLDRRPRPSGQLQQQGGPRLGRLGPLRGRGGRRGHGGGQGGRLQDREGDAQIGRAQRMKILVG